MRREYVPHAAILRYFQRVFGHVIILGKVGRIFNPA